MSNLLSDNEFPASSPNSNKEGILKLLLMKINQSYNFNVYEKIRLILQQILYKLLCFPLFQEFFLLIRNSKSHYSPHSLLFLK